MTNWSAKTGMTDSTILFKYTPYWGKQTNHPLKLQMAEVTGTSTSLRMQKNCSRYQYQFENAKNIENRYQYQFDNAKIIETVNSTSLNMQ